MPRFEELEAWKRSHELALAVYQATKTFPKAELYGLTSQTRRAAFSVPANLVEGLARRGIKELRRSREMRGSWRSKHGRNSRSCDGQPGTCSGGSIARSGRAVVPVSARLCPSLPDPARPRPTPPEPAPHRASPVLGSISRIP